ncbi:MAG: NAD(+) diphosphatase [Oscillospiraceae bacterium]|nr:NAD(+) diphosphatase [Oscillospiraceae bacterium]
MLQDLAVGRLENEFRNITALAEDRILCFREGQILLSRGTDDTLTLPTLSYMEAGADGANMPYLFRLSGENYFLWTGDAPVLPEGGFAYEPVRQLRQLKSKEICFAVMTGWHLYNWYRSNRLCGCCGTPTDRDSKERMLRCPNCGNMIFPRINPAVIVAVTHGDRLLLSKYAGRAYTRFALIAGFTEIGETLEQTVCREVLEEVGLQVKNIRYYKSQPWGVDGNILMGFFCDVDGSTEIHIDENELSMADWYDRKDLPAHDDGISLTREMIRVFEEGREPKAQGGDI